MPEKRLARTRELYTDMLPRHSMGKRVVTSMSDSDLLKLKKILVDNDLDENDLRDFQKAMEIFFNGTLKPQD